MKRVKAVILLAALIMGVLLCLRTRPGDANKGMGSSSGDHGTAGVLNIRDAAHGTAPSNSEAPNDTGLEHPEHIDAPGARDIEREMGDLHMAVLRKVKRGSCREALAYLKSIVERPAAMTADRVLRALAIRLVAYIGSSDPTLKPEICTWLKGLMLDPDEWSRCTALGAYFGLEVQILIRTDGTVGFNIRIRDDFDPAELVLYSLRDEATRDPDSIKILDRAMRLSGTRDGKKAALYGLGCVLDPENPEFLPILEYVMTYEEDLEMQDAALNYLLLYPLEQGYPLVERAIQKCGPGTPKALLWVAARGAWSPETETVARRLMTSGRDDFPKEGDYAELKSQVTRAVALAYSKTREGTLHSILANALAHPTDEASLQITCEEIAENGDPSFVPLLRDAEAQRHPFNTLDRIRRAIELLDPGYQGTRSLCLQIERIERRLEDTSLSEEERAELKAKAAELRAETRHRAHE